MTNLLHYCISRDVHLDTTVRVAVLEGKRPDRRQQQQQRQQQQLSTSPTLRKQPRDYFEDPFAELPIPELTVSVQLYAEGRELCLPVYTAYRANPASSSSSTNDYSSDRGVPLSPTSPDTPSGSVPPQPPAGIWNEWLTLPVRLSDLPLSTVLLVRVWDLDGLDNIRVLGGTTLSLFDNNGILVQGRQRLHVWIGCDADPGSKHKESCTPAIGPEENRTEMDRLESLLLQHERGKIAPVEWLDALVFREIERIHQTELSSSNSAQRTHPDGNQPQTMCLYIELPTFDVPVVHGEPEITAASDPFLLRPAEPTLSFVNDPEMYRENPTELMHRRLARSHRGAPLDRELKPNARIRDELNNIIKYPPTRSLDTHEKDLVWTFRFYLSRNKQALTKFLKSVSWTDAQEVRQAIELMDQWSLIDVSDALELLGHDFSHPKVRGYAVNRLKAAANDDDLLLYLLQLVQALRFDVVAAAMYASSSSPSASSSSMQASEIDSGLADFLIERSVSSPILANYLHWYLRVECEAKGKIGHMYSRISSRFLDALQSAYNEQQQQLRSRAESLADAVQPIEPEHSSGGGSSSLTASTGSLHIVPATAVTSSPAFAPVVPGLEQVTAMPISSMTSAAAMVNVASESDIVGAAIASAINVPQPVRNIPVVHSDTAQSVSSHTSITAPTVGQPLDYRDSLRRQGELIQYLSRISKELRSSRELRTRKIERLRQIIASPQSGLSSFPPLTFPLDPSIRITGIVADNSSIFKSSMMPLFLTFKTGNDGDGSGQREYRAMFKTGDDLRQDQLVIQLITLMDKLLRNENLDLRLMPYKALATGHDSGFIQLIDAEALASILTDHAGSLLSYLRLHRPDPSPSGILGVDPTVMDTYIRSCAGYCVITYLLGVGDRHLDNLMLTRDGNLFHIDFGFILGRDPKPFPPPMKLCKEMIEAMGGEQSPLFQQQFRSYCYTAFGILRRSANLILNLLSLMVDAGIPDIAVEPDRAVLKVQEKFRLDLTEEEAVELFDTLITDSANALFPQIVERLHAWAQYWRA